MKQRLLSRPWYAKNRTPDQGRKEHQEKGVGVHAKASERKKAAKDTLLPIGKKRLLNEEMLNPPGKRKRKKPWSRWLQDFAKWLIILKLFAALINEVYQIVN